MGITAQDVIKVMQGWIGADKRAIIDLYNNHRPLAQGYAVKYTDAWCDTTVSACFIKLNATDLIGGTECGVERHIQLFKNKGIWEEDGQVTPKAGAIICYNWDDGTQPNDGFADHIGIVEKVSGGQITVIEGNYNDAVRRRTIPVGWGYIRGYAFPKYSDAQTNVPTTPTPTKTSSTKMKYNENNKPLVCMLTNSTCYNGTGSFQPKGILWHCTGCNNPNLWRYVQPSNNDPNKNELLAKIGKNNYGSDWNHGTVYAGVNAWIGKLANGEVATVQALPWNYAPWGCASGAYGSCNNTHIQFEMCEDALNDKAYFEKCYKEGVELTAYLCKMYGINPKGTTRVGSTTVPTILCHYDAYNYGVGSGHYDVYNWFNKYGKTMDDVRNDVAKLLDQSDTPSEPPKKYTISYKAHCQTYGWMPYLGDGEWAGTTGQSKRLEGLIINPPEGVELEVVAHLQKIGDTDPYTGIVHGNNKLIGTTGESRRMEGISIKCVKNNTGKKLKYQGHCQTYGNTKVCSEGEYCGTKGEAKRLEAIRIWFE